MIPLDVAMNRPALSLEEILSHESITHIPFGDIQVAHGDHAERESVIGFGVSGLVRRGVYLPADKEVCSRSRLFARCYVAHPTPRIEWLPYHLTTTHACGYC